jgi:TolB-like protein/Tfp pilus assembly protein PilF
VNSVTRVCQKCGTEIPADAPEGGCPGCLLETALDAAGGQKVFGRYTLVKVLGRGGMGIVWLAHDEELERDVALKFLPDLMIQDRALLDQLKRETKRCLDLTHSHIVRIYDFVHDERSGCISMEYIDGETLSNLRAKKEQRVFEPDEIAIWISQLCDALDYAHTRAKVIHSDLKPANLMVNQHGDLKVADFGIARSLTDSVSRLTIEQGRRGTLVYMGPQQLNGERCTHSDDIYSLGATIYELLTSKPPFYSGNIDRQICERVAPSMMERRKEFNIEPASVPQTWEKVVAACLAKDPSRRPQSVLEVAQPLQLPSGQARIGIAPAQPAKKKLMLMGGIAAAAALVLAIVYFGESKRHSMPVSQPPAIPEKSIAVLPFENLSDQKQNAYFTDGVQDEILTHLAKVADLKVISRTSVMQYRNVTTRNVREIAHELGVVHVLEGSVQRAGDRVRVSAQLIDARTDTNIWADHYDRNVTDVFALESDLAQQIVSKLKAKLSPQEKTSIEQQPTGDLVAYELYRQAQGLDDALNFDAKVNEHLPEAARLLQEAVRRDPDFFGAYCLLARIHDEIYFWGIDQSPARLAQAQSALDSARRLRPDAGEWHLAVAQHLYWGYRNYAGAEQELAIAAQALPNERIVFELLAYMERRQGRWDASTHLFQHALELDPRNLSLLQQVAMTYQYLRRFTDAAAVLDRALSIAPNNAGTRLRRAEIELWWRADPKPIEAVFATVLLRDPTAASDFAAQLLDLALCERNSEKAQQALTALGAGDSYENSFPYSHAFFEGLVARLRGDSVAAREAFTRARAELEIILRQQPSYAEGFSMLGLIDAGLGDREQAVREARRAAELLPVTKDSINGSIIIEHSALTHAWLGENDLALAELDTAARLPGRVSYGYLKLHPMWDPLRGDPRFEKIVASFTPAVKAH